MSYKRNVSLKTIAYELNVSINTVSRALRDCSDISEKTKKKVRQKALELGYLPNKIIHSMNEENSKLIALVINNMKNYYFTIMSEKIMYLLKKEGYLCVIICLYGNSFTSETVKECVYQRVDGIVSFVEPTKESLEYVKLNNIPFLMLGRKIDDDYCDMLYTDDEKGGEIAAKYLCDEGCDHFIYVNVEGSECAIRRYQGFSNYLRFVKKTRKFKKVNTEDFNNFLDNLENYDKLGIFCYNDENAFNILNLLDEHNIDKSKIKIIGYDAVSQNINGTIKIPSVGFDYMCIAKTVNYCVTTNLTKREKISMCFDVKLFNKGDVDEIN